MRKLFGWHNSICWNVFCCFYYYFSNSPSVSVTKSPRNKLVTADEIHRCRWKPTKTFTYSRNSSDLRWSKLTLRSEKRTDFIQTINKISKRKIINFLLFYFRYILFFDISLKPETCPCNKWKTRSNAHTHTRKIYSKIEWNANKTMN